MTRARGDHALGLHDGDDFELVDGRDAAASAGRQAAWYFADECVAIPRAKAGGRPYATSMRPFDDVRTWDREHAAVLPAVLPPLVWIGARERIRGARIASDLASFEDANGRRALALAERLPLNGSWPDATTGIWLTSQPSTLVGTNHGGRFEARVLWPEAFRLGPLPPPACGFDGRADVPAQLRALVRESRADAPFSASTLWQRGPRTDWRGCAVLAFVLNGAQGDDDEAHAGHFAIATGRVADDGGIGNWLVASLYPLDTVSEKGILAAPTPLSSYQADVNAGQSWYRPTWIMAAILDGDRAANRVQQALDRVFRHYWRHQLAYYHPLSNCTSISVDTLQALGMTVRTVGPTSRLAAWLGFPALVARERSLAKARVAFDYLVVERTRLLPALALEAIGSAIVSLANGEREAESALERELAEDLCGIAWLRLPQFPSSRAWGGPPVASLAEYRSRLPRDRSRWKIIPVPPRPLPPELRDENLLPPLPRPSDLAARAWAFGPLALAAATLVVTSR